MFLNKAIRRSKVHHGSHDDFIRRIRSLAIGSEMLQRENIPLLDCAVKNIPEEGSVIEVGSYGGLSINLIIHLLNKYNKNNSVFNCDAWIYEGFHDCEGAKVSTIDGRADIERTAYSDYMKQAYINATHFLSAGCLPHTFHIFSDDFFKMWRTYETATDLFGRDVQLGGPIAFAYIDGGHAFDQAKNDYYNVAENMIKGGFILFDDSARHLKFGSAALMATVKQDKRFEIADCKNNFMFRRK